MSEKKDTAFLQADAMNKAAHITNTIITMYHSVICDDGTVAGRIANRIAESLHSAVKVFEGDSALDIKEKFLTKEDSPDGTLN